MYLEADAPVDGLDWREVDTDDDGVGGHVLAGHLHPGARSGAEIDANLERHRLQHGSMDGVLNSGYPENLTWETTVGMTGPHLSKAQGKPPSQLSSKPVAHSFTF